MADIGKRQRDVGLLIVDDEEEFTLVMSKRLGRLGYDVCTANSGKEALQLARVVDFRVAVLDLKMAGIDGMETLRTLLVLLPRLKVIMLTGHGSKETARQCLNMGAFSYLYKPCEFNHLVEEIERALESGDEPAKPR